LGGLQKNVLASLRKGVKRDSKNKGRGNKGGGGQDTQDLLGYKKDRKFFTPENTHWKLQLGGGGCLVKGTERGMSYVGKLVFAL